MHHDIAKRIDVLRNDRIHGAGWLTGYALQTLIMATDKTQKHSIHDLIKEIESISNEQQNARPGLVSIANVGRLYTTKIKESARSFRSIAALANESVERGRDLLAKMGGNTAQAAVNCANWLSDGDTIITCSFSSLVIQSLAAASKRGLKSDVIVCQSKVGSISYGMKMSTKLTEKHVNHKVIEDNLIPSLLKTVSKVLLGADSVLSTGSIVNGTPSLQLAASANIMSIPVASVCESIKFDTHNRLGKRPVTDQGFDIVDYWLWSQIITEAGIIVKNDFNRYLDSLKAVQ